MKTLLKAHFTQPNLPQIAIPNMPAFNNFVPAYLSVSLQSWFEARFKEVSASGGSLVQSWTDNLSTSGVTMGPTVTPPTYVAAAQNGLAGIANTKTAQGGLPAQCLFSSAAPTSLQFLPASPFTIAVAFKTGPKFSNSVIVGVDDPTIDFGGFPPINGWAIEATGNISGFLQFTLASTLAAASPVGIVTATSNALMQPNTNYIAVVTYDGSMKAAGVNIYVNSTQPQAVTAAADTLTAATVTTTASQRLSFLGLNKLPPNGPQNNDTYSEFFGGTIYASLIFNDILTAYGIQQVFNYLDAAYAIF